MKNEKGFVLIMSYLLLSVLSVFSLALFSRSNVFLRATERNQNKIVAFNLAEAGLDTAIAALRANPAYAGTGGYVPMQTNTVQGGYQVTVTTPAQTPTGQPNVNAAIRQITATGFSPTNTVTDRAYETRTITGYMNVAPPSLFDYAVFADEEIDITGGARLDSYDTRVNPVYNPRTAGSKADVGTNGTGDDKLKLSGTPIVRGGALSGAGSDPSQVIELNGQAQITGTQSALTSPKDMTPSQPSGNQLGTLNITEPYPLGAGTYRASSLRITGDGKLVATGDVKLYVEGDITIAGQGTATSGDLPTKLQIHATTNADVKIAGGGSIYGGIYAPLSKVKVTGNSDVYGAIVAKKYEQHGTGKIHFDEAMKDVKANNTNQVNMLSWTESNTSLGS